MAVRRPEELSRLRRIEVDAARLRSGHVFRGSRGDDIGDGVAVHVANVAGDPAELIVHPLPVPFVDHRGRFDEGVLEVLWGGKQGGEARVSLESGKLGGNLDLRHVDLACGLGLGEPREGGLQLALRGIGNADAVEGRRYGRLDLERAGPGLDRAVEVRDPLPGRPQRAPGATVSGLTLDQLLEEGGGPLGIVRLQACERLW